MLKLQNGRLQYTRDVSRDSRRIFGVGGPQEVGRTAERPARLVAANGSPSEHRLDFGALIDVILKVSRLATDHRDEIEELDTNRLVLSDQGAKAVVHRSPEKLSHP